MTVSPGITQIPIIKCADDTTVVGLIHNNEAAYREEVELVAGWCTKNNLCLNIIKTKELIVDFRRHNTNHMPIYIDGSAVERVESFKFLGVHITQDLSWSLHIS